MAIVESEAKREHKFEVENAVRTLKEFGQLKADKKLFDEAKKQLLKEIAVEQAEFGKPS